MTNQAKVGDEGNCNPCHYATRIKDGHPLSVGICTLCGGIDWDTLASDFKTKMAGADAIGFAQGVLDHDARVGLRFAGEPDDHSKCTVCGKPWDDLHQTRREAIAKVVALENPARKAIEVGQAEMMKSGPRYGDRVRVGCGATGRYLGWHLGLPWALWISTMDHSVMLDDTVVIGGDLPAPDLSVPSDRELAVASAALTAIGIRALEIRWRKGS